MSQAFNIVETSAMDKSRELDGIVPESTYYHSTSIIQRHHAKMSPFEGGLIDNADKSKGIQYNWQINATPNSVLNLNEMYYEIVGTLEVELNLADAAYKTEVDAGKSVIVDSENLLTPSDLWFHSAFQNVQLRIGDAVIANTNNPIVYNVFRKLMFHGEEKDDVRGFAGSHAFRFGSYSTTHEGVYNFSSGSIKHRRLTFTKPASGYLVKQKLEFRVIMTLADLFDTDDLLPIFNQQVKISLQRSAIDDISIQCNIPGCKVKLDKFNYFQLNIFQYLLDPANSAALMNVYSKPKTVVYSTKTQVFQTVTNTQHSTQVTINSPTGLLFGAKFLMMYLAKSNTTNNIVPTLTLPTTATKAYDSVLVKNNTGANVLIEREKISKLQASRFPSLYMGPHAPLNLMYQNVNINCDNYTVLYDDVAPQIQTVADSDLDETITIAPGVYFDLVPKVDTDVDAGNKSSICQYSRLYHEYVESCKHTGVCPISREEYMNCYPVIMAELSDFSKISTNSFLNITLTNGRDYTEADWKSPYKIDGNEHNQINILCYGLRALEMSNGYARLKEIDNTVNNDMDDVIATQ